MSISLELNWQSDVNHFADGTNPAEWLPWYLAKGLSSGTVSGITAGLWTVIASSDGTVADTNDNWGSTFDAAKIVADDAGNPHSWILLQSPEGLTGGPYYMLIDCRYAGHPEAVRIVFSAEAFDLASPSVDNAPETTDTDAMMVFNQCSRIIGAQPPPNFPPTNGVYLGAIDIVTPQHYGHLRVASTGEFVFNTSYNAGDTFYSHVHFLQMRSTLAADTKPVQALALGGAYTNKVDYAAPFTPDSSPLGSLWSFDSNTNNPQIVEKDFTNLKAFAIPYDAENTSSVKTQYCIFTFISYDFQGQLKYNAVDKSMTSAAINCFSTIDTGASAGTLSNYRGRLADVYLCPPIAYSTPTSSEVYVNQGDVSPASSPGNPFSFVKIGTFWFPWNSTSLPNK